MSDSLSSVISTIQQEGSQNEAARQNQLQRVKTALEYRFNYHRIVVLTGIHLDSYGLEILNLAIGELNPRHGTFNICLQACTWNPQLPKSALQLLSKSHYLLLTDCGITDQQIAEIKTSNLNPAGLDLSHNLITSEGAAALLDSPTPLGEFGGIDLSFNKIDSRIVPILLEKIRTGRLQETYLDLSGNLLTEEDKMSLKTAALNTSTRIILEVDHQAQSVIDQNLDSVGKTRHYRKPSFAGTIPVDLTEKLLIEWISVTSKQLATIQNETEYETVLQQSVRNMQRLIEKDQGLAYLDASNIPLNDHVVRVLIALLKPDYKTSLTGIALRWTSAHTPELFEKFLTILQKPTQLQKLKLDYSVLTDEDHRKLFEVLKTNTVLKELSLWNTMVPNSNSGLGLAEVISSNSTLQELNLHDLDINDAGRAAILEAVRTNFTLVQHSAKLEPVEPHAPYFERNRRLAALEPIERMKAIQQEHLKEKPGQPVPSEKNPIPKLKDILQYRIDQKSAEAISHAREADDNSEIKKTLRLLKEFLESEQVRLRQKVKNVKGRDDKSFLYSALITEVNDSLRLKSRELSPESVTDLFRKAAIIAHHRRYSKWNTFASLFNSQYRTAESWKLFTQKFAQAPEGKEIIKAFPTWGIRPALTVKIRGEDQTVKRYNQYRKLAMPRPT